MRVRQRWGRSSSIFTNAITAVACLAGSVPVAAFRLKGTSRLPLAQIHHHRRSDQFRAHKAEVSRPLSPTPAQYGGGKQKDKPHASPIALANAAARYALDAAPARKTSPAITQTAPTDEGCFSHSQYPPSVIMPTPATPGSMLPGCMSSQMQANTPITRTMNEIVGLITYDRTRNPPISVSVWRARSMGNSNQNVAPGCGELLNVPIWPPIISMICLLTVSPKPVPPKRRRLVPSA